MGLYAELRGFVLAHRACGVLRGDRDGHRAGPSRLSVACPCGARFERVLCPDDPDADRLRSALLAFEDAPQSRSEAR